VKVRQPRGIIREHRWAQSPQRGVEAAPCAVTTPCAFSPLTNSFLQFLPFENQPLFKNTTHLPRPQPFEHNFEHHLSDSTMPAYLSASAIEKLSLPSSCLHQIFKLYVFDYVATDYILGLISHLHWQFSTDPKAGIRTTPRSWRPKNTIMSNMCIPAHALQMSSERCCRCLSTTYLMA
jgi:hypothetical protein